MPLSSGSRLGSHEILGLLGAGGMGEVYRALDTKLNRQVAIKVLPEAYAADAERVGRFHREAQAVAALNHPQIAAIYDLAEADGTKYLVLELIEGDTLAERLRKGPMPVDEAVRIASQILEALEAAHEKGICHRDLKPANIKLTPEGAVKVLDFGLAKFLESAPSAVNPAQSPTLSVAGTLPGVILGTAGYMSPEQAKGHQADHRSDIFSFGCIFYELLTGRQPFDGDTVSEILAGVLKSDIDLATLPPRLNPRLTELLRRCLEKNPKKRWHAAADVRVELEAVAGRALVVDAPANHAAASRPLWRRVIPVAAGVVAGAFVAGAAAWSLKPEPSRQVTRFEIPLQAGQTFTNSGRQLVAVSAEGSLVAYVADLGLHVRPLNGLAARPIAGSRSGAGVTSVTFSPDGRSLAYFSAADGTLKRIAVDGGVAVTICKATPPLGLTWHEGSIVFGQEGRGILRVAENGGEPEVIAAPGEAQILSNPQMLPDGRTVLFSAKKVTDGWDRGSIVVQPIGGAPRTIVAEGSAARYLPTGHLVFATQGVLMGAPFDVGTLTLTGAPVPLVEGVRRTGMDSGGAGTAQVAFSSSGTLAYLPGPAELGDGGNADLALFDWNGTAQPLNLPPGAYRSPRVSPDGTLVAFDTGLDHDAVVWIYQLAGGTAMRRLTFGGSNRHPAWSHDGQWVFFQSDREGDRGIFRQRADGSGAAERVTRPENDAEHVPQMMAPDGARLLYSERKGSNWALWTTTMAEHKAALVEGTQSVALAEGAFSPNGQWIAYQARQSGPDGNLVYLQPFPQTGAKYLVGPGGHPYWTAKGDRLIVNAGPGESEIIPVITAPTVQFGKPIRFSRERRAEPNPSTTRRNTDALPDGAHIVGVTNSSSVSNATSITVVLNWFDEVRQRFAATTASGSPARR